jgi:UDP-N-acetylbacillosamine N-acetyltransferase
MVFPVRSPLVIWGTSGHARVVADIIRCGTEFEIVGFLDDVNPDRHGSRFCDSSILGGREQLHRLAESGVRHFLLGFGDNAARRRLGRELQDSGYALACAVHPRAIVARDVRMGAGSVVMGGAVVNPNVDLGENVIVNTGATVDHDCVLGDAVHISPGAHLAGAVRIGDESWIGLGSVVLEKRQVGARSIVGAGAVVTRDVPEGVVAFGVPAKVMKSR